MGCPKCGTNVVIESPKSDGYLAFACGYSDAGTKIYPGMEMTARNGSRTKVEVVHPVTSWFRVHSINPQGMSQFLWYNKAGECWGPTGTTRWHGDDMHPLSAELFDNYPVSECQRRGDQEDKTDERWDDII